MKSDAQYNNSSFNLLEVSGTTKTWEKENNKLLFGLKF